MYDTAEDLVRKGLITTVKSKHSDEFKPMTYNILSFDKIKDNISKKLKKEMDEKLKRIDTFYHSKIYK